ncbi:MAG: hypothetical protein J3Q66DRAFT_58918 [Benniella sp.]|nr:MAG: hypothetical protein J3Q66DRAFT_58918 [Benniella sp.]
MLDITELDDMIYPQLRRHDLAQCALVSKKWHSLVIPHLWRDVSGESTYSIDCTMWAFFRMIREDYNAEKRYQELQDGEQSTQARSPLPLSALSKYGHLIRVLPDPNQISGPPEMLQHLLRHCHPDVQVKYFRMSIEAIDHESDNPWKEIVDFTLPRVRVLYIDINGTPRSSSISKWMDVLDRRSVVLERLRLNVRIPNMETKVEPMEHEPKTCTSLRELLFYRVEYNTGAEEFWSSLFRRCGRVEKLQVESWIGSVQRLAQGMLAYMPDLNEISLGHGNDEVIGLDDAAVGTLLSGSRKGWKVVRSRLYFGRAAIDALSKHTSTLELLDIWGCDATLSRRLGQVLSSCGNLHSLLSTDYDKCDPPHFCARIDYKAFIDLDPNTGAPKPWECEGTLKKLRVIITGIPHSDLEEGDNVEGAYPTGERREIQGRVYDRLARFINLETLCLGDHWSQESQDMDMSLRSGLGKLSGLKKLRKIGECGPGRGVGIKEVQWMVANWPSLRVVRGLERDEVRAWLEKNTDIDTLNYSSDS